MAWRTHPLWLAEVGPWPKSAGRGTFQCCRSPRIRIDPPRGSYPGRVKARGWTVAVSQDKVTSVDEARPKADPNTLEAVGGRSAIKAALLALVLVVLGCYALHLKSPLRLNTDAVIILTAAMHHNSGFGFNHDGEQPVYPRSALHAFAALDRWGLGTASGYTAINLVSIAMGILAWGYVVRRAWGFGQGLAGWTTSLAVIAWVLLSFTLIKHVAIPLTDLPFFAISGLAMVAITAVGTVSNLRLRVGLMVLAAVLTVLAVATRTIGICLLPAFVLAFYRLLPPDGVDSRLRRWWKPTTLVLLTGAVVAGGLIAINTTYWQQMKAIYASAPLTELVYNTVVQRIIEMGQLLSNVPSSLAVGPVRWVVAGLGGAFLLAVFLGRLLLAKRYPERGGRFQPLDAMILAYLAVMAVWPYAADTRFWIPLLVVFGACLVTSGLWASRGRVGGSVVGVVVLVYVGLGTLALATSVRLCVSGEAFADRYGTPAVQASYRAAWGLPPKEDLPPPDRRYVRVLHYVESRSR